MSDDERGAGPDAGADPAPQRGPRTGRAAAAARMAHHHSWVEEQVRVAMAAGEFDDLPGAGKPIAGLGGSHDPDWWLRGLIERERLSVLPASLQLRKDDAELDDRLDRIGAATEVRREVEEFNARVMRARYSPQDGQPPLITMPRDVEAEVTAWEQRRSARREAALAEAAARREAVEAARASGAASRWWRRRAWLSGRQRQGR